MNRIVLFACICLGYATAVAAQQQPRLALYNFAPIAFNPATAGAELAPQIRLIHRQQWLGIEGGPVTQVLQGDLPMGKVGLGLGLSNDQAGALGQSNLQAAYSYQIRLDPSWTLRGGLSASVANWRSQWDELRIEQGDDVVFAQNLNRWMPNAGAGLLLQHTYWQLGIGIPQLFEYDLREAKDAGNTAYARTYRHGYIHTKARLPLQDGQVELRPSLLFRSTGFLSGGRKEPFNIVGSPAASDLGLQVFWPALRLGAGLSWRSAWQRGLSSDDALSLQANWQLRNGIQIGGAYDISLNALQRTSGGSFEVMLGYVFRAREPERVTTAQTHPSVPKQLPPNPISVQPTPVTPKETADVAEDPVEPYYVKGLIFDMTNGLTMENARVTLSNTCGDPAPKAYITSAKGNFSFELKPGCCYTVQVEKDGFKTDQSAQICPKKQANGEVIRVELSLFKL